MLLPPECGSELPHSKGFTGEIVCHGVEREALEVARQPGRTKQGNQLRHLRCEMRAEVPIQPEHHSAARGTELCRHVPDVADLVGQYLVVEQPHAFGEGRLCGEELHAAIAQGAEEHTADHLAEPTAGSTQCGGASTNPLIIMRISGTGLGLAIAREFTEAHGGRLWVEGADGGGARVVTWLPIRPAG